MQGLQLARVAGVWMSRERRIVGALGADVKQKKPQPHLAPKPMICGF